MYRSTSALLRLIAPPTRLPESGRPALGLQRLPSPGGERRTPVTQLRREPMGAAWVARGARHHRAPRCGLTRLLVASDFRPSYRFLFFVLFFFKRMKIPFPRKSFIYFISSTSQSVARMVVLLTAP